MKQCFEIERSRIHCQLAFRISGPLLLRTVPVELNTVAVGIAQIEGFADTVVGCSIELYSGAQQAFKGVAQLCLRGVDNGEMIQPGCASRRRISVFALPGVQTDVVVISASGEEGCGVAHALRDVEPEDAVIEGKRAIHVGHLQVNVAHAHAVMDRLSAHAVVAVSLHALYAFGAGGVRPAACIVFNMSTLNPSFDYAAEAERKRLLAEEDRKSFLKVVIYAGIALFVMFVVLLSILMVMGQRDMPLDHSHREANTFVQMPAVNFEQTAGLQLRLAA